MTGNRPFDNPLDRPVSGGLPQEFLDRFEAHGVHEPDGPTLGAPLYEDLSDPGPYPDGPSHLDSPVVLSDHARAYLATKDAAEAERRQGFTPRYGDVTKPETIPIAGISDEEPSASLRSPGGRRGRVRARLANSAGPLALGGFDRIQRKGGKIHRRRPLPGSTGPDNDGTPISYHDEQQGEQ